MGGTVELGSLEQVLSSPNCAGGGTIGGTDSNDALRLDDADVTFDDGAECGEGKFDPLAEIGLELTEREFELASVCPCPGITLFLPLVEPPELHVLLPDPSECSLEPSEFSGDTSSSDQTQSPALVRCNRPEVPGGLFTHLAFLALSSIDGPLVRRVEIKYLRSLAFLKKLYLRSSVADGLLAGSFCKQSAIILRIDFP